MLRAIFAALAAGMRKIWGLAVPLFTWPFSIFGGGGGRSKPAVDPGILQAVERKVQASGLKPPELAQSQARDSQIALACIRAALLTRTSVMLPTTMSRSLKDWLPGLNYGQLVALRDAGAAGICAHFSGKTPIAGVPKVAKLPPVVVKFPPAADPQLSATPFSKIVAPSYV